MLVQFRIKNFRSFKDEAVLNLAASSDKTNEAGSVVSTSIPAVPRVLRCVGIYGANASGKSNLVRALQLLRGIVNDSASLQAGQELNIQPFRLDPKTDAEPTEYELTFILDGVRYQFGFKLTSKRILSEWLIAYKTSQPALWYERNYDKATDKDKYSFGNQLRGKKSVWSNVTGENTLFISRAVQLNSDQLRPIFDYLTKGLVVFENGGLPPLDHTLEHISKNSARAVKQFLSTADIGIEEIELRKQPGKFREIKLDLATGGVEAPPEVERELLIPTFHHKTRTGSAVFEIHDESEGTRKLFALAGPIFNILESGQILIVDELDRSIHALLVRQLIAMFQDPKVNTGGAQLIFTTHDTSLLDGDLLRRDQIWFTEKDADQASRLYPLSDFSTRKDAPHERAYLTGRYGGVPILRPLKFS